jgi:hypothetical protein
MLIRYLQTGTDHMSLAYVVARSVGVGFDVLYRVVAAVVFGAAMAALFFGIADSTSGAIDALAKWAGADVHGYTAPFHAWVQDPRHADFVALVGYLSMLFGAAFTFAERVQYAVLRVPRSTAALLLGVALVAEVGAPVDRAWAFWITAVAMVGAAAQVRRDGVDAAVVLVLQIVYAIVYPVIAVVGLLCSETTSEVSAERS